MATHTSVKSGNWSDSTVWGGSVPVDGDSVVIDTAHTVLLDADYTSMANGIAGLDIKGIMHVKPDILTGLKINGNITSSNSAGALYVANRTVTTGFTLTSGKTNTYEKAVSVWVMAVEETLGQGYALEAQEQLLETAIINENTRRRNLKVPEMMPDELQTFIATTLSNLTLTDYLNYVESHSGSFYCDRSGGKVYIHTSDNSNPSTKTITLIDCIQRPTSGSSYRCRLIFSATGSLYVPILKMYGWEPSNPRIREWDTISADISGSNTVLPALTNGLDLQSGDIIAIGCGSQNYFPSEGRLTYTVSSYNLKVITLSSPISTARKSGDYIEIISRPIQLTRTTNSNANPALINPNNYPSTLNINNVVLIGVYVNYITLSGVASATPQTGWTIKHTSFYRCYSTSTGWGIGGLSGLDGAIIKDCTGLRNTPFLQYVLNTNPHRCIFIFDETDGQWFHNCTFVDCIIQSCWAPGYTDHKNCEIKNCGNVVEYNQGNPSNPIKPPLIKNCHINGGNGVSNTSKDGTGIILKDCIFEDNSNNYNTTSGSGLAGYLANHAAKLYNCLFKGTEICEVINETRRNVDETIESFDHNQIPGNYKAWMRGGRIETNDSRLKFTCESNDYPVYRDYILLAPANRTVKFPVTLTKSAAGILVKLEIIDPADDPLIDSSAEPLASVTAENNTDTQQLGISYRATTAKQLILRVSCQATTGNVEVDVSRIEQMLQKRFVFIEG